MLETAGITNRIIVADKWCLTVRWRVALKVEWLLRVDRVKQSFFSNFHNRFAASRIRFLFLRTRKVLNKTLAICDSIFPVDFCYFPRSWVSLFSSVSVSVFLKQDQRPILRAMGPLFCSEHRCTFSTRSRFCGMFMNVWYFWFFCTGRTRLLTFLDHLYRMLPVIFDR